MEICTFSPMNLMNLFSQKFLLLIWAKFVNNLFNRNCFVKNDIVLLGCFNKFKRHEECADSKKIQNPLNLRNNTHFDTIDITTTI